MNILPGRDGLLHISKLGSGRRVDRVEDVLSLGTEVEVRVDDIDPQGKVSLSLVKPLDGSAGEAAAAAAARAARSGGNGGGGGGGGGGDRDVVSFDSDWDQTARDSFGELGPAEVTPVAAAAGPAKAATGAATGAGAATAAGAPEAVVGRGRR